jgi:hypothetical protein
LDRLHPNVLRSLYGPAIWDSVGLGIFSRSYHSRWTTYGVFVSRFFYSAASLVTKFRSFQADDVVVGQTTSLLSSTSLAGYDARRIAKCGNDRSLMLTSHLGIGIGIAQGLLFTPVINVAMQHFSKRRALASGAVVCGTSIGGVIWPIMLKKLFAKPSVGFAWGVRATTFMMLACLATGNLLMRTKVPNRRQRAAMGIVTPKPDVKGIVTDVGWVIVGIG